MDLNQWMKETRTTSGEIAAAIGRSGSYVRELRRGARTPSIPTAQAIAVFTEGRVGLDEWPVQQAPNSPEVPAESAPTPDEEGRAASTQRRPAWPAKANP
ncbi:MAG: hypothetical protein GC155_06135 [Alphaproteobacteria bacterium]|nr:hypothetical protein [Alphaproteobacteria bacterium]